MRGTSPRNGIGSTHSRHWPSLPTTDTMPRSTRLDRSIRSGAPPRSLRRPKHKWRRMCSRFGGPAKDIILFPIIWTQSKRYAPSARYATNRLTSRICRLPGLLKNNGHPDSQQRLAAKSPSNPANPQPTLPPGRTPSSRVLRGCKCYATAAASLQLRHVHPAAFVPGLQAQLGQLHALGPFEQGPAEGRVFGEVLEE